MKFKKPFLAALLAIGLGITAMAAPPVTTVDPRTIGFTMSTIAADALQFEAPTAQSSAGAPQFHEDEWRQIEFFPAARLPELQKRLKEYKTFEQQNRVPQGWKDIYARRIAGAPLAGTPGPREVAALLQGTMAPAPILTTASAPLGQVKGGFTIRLAGSVFLYGIADGSTVHSLAAMVERGGDERVLTAAFTRLYQHYKLVLVDWRGQMLLTSVEPNGAPGIWRP
ncbi:hypothetical protein PMI15_04613 [Polaromonas sp. CF318]|uniref:hypothetical protein n=1 Tax=Polaromonas sp. CF318 TaxID=1144318 RepID=UPI00027135FE|nr:hypothetical protein [Polaromonas sp. CF318]EJL77583.1 hypothetical protein PMI15_04613 [Polaromonas sp. CF318]